jgi:hypothetical protein
MENLNEMTWDQIYNSKNIAKSPFQSVGFYVHPQLNYPITISWVHEIRVISIGDASNLTIDEIRTNHEILSLEKYSYILFNCDDPDCHKFLMKIIFDPASKKMELKMVKPPMIDADSIKIQYTTSLVAA